MKLWAESVMWLRLRNPSPLVTSQVSRLRINDSGTYQCLVQTGEGADYKEISLSVTGINLVCDSLRNSRFIG